ncbi:MAG: SufD family Fe-S cluster assembly protein, partial [Bdellovibrionales bacterium]|nr:SufD family Fe-S cluster assembly protein [Bdellovibrionales bacterium]
MSNHNQDLKWIESGFAALEAKLNGASNLPVHQLRKQALENLFETGFPSSRDEDWKYTNVKDLLKRSYSLSKKDDSKVNLESIIFSEAGYRLIFVDNSFNSNLSRLPEGISAFTISEILRNPEHESYSNLKLRLSEYTEWGAYAALNTAFSTDGFYLHLKENQKVDQPIHLIFITSSSEIATHPRVILELDKNSSLSIVETYTGSGSKYFTTAVTQINMAEDSYCDHYRIQDEALDAFHFSSLRTTQASSSILKTNSFAFG